MLKYRSRPQVQFTSAGIAALVVLVLSYLFSDSIDWPTVIGVALGVFLGLGFARKGQDVGKKEGGQKTPPQEPPRS